MTKGGQRGVSDDELKRDYLNYLKWAEPLALMLELGEDEDFHVRCSAANALGKIGSEAAIRALVEALYQFKMKLKAPLILQ